jgi:cysteine-S-conjugate beta-lyase
MPDSVSLSAFDAVISRAGTDAMKWDKYKNQDVLPFWVADMDFAIAEPIQAALLERMKHPILGYTLPSDGLSLAVRDFLQNEYQWDVLAEWLVWLPGVVCGLAASCRAYAKPGEALIVNPPIYHHFFDSHEPHHHVERLPLQCGNTHRWTWDFASLEERLKVGGVGAIMLCSPHNPTGTVFTRDELNTMMALASAYDVTVVSDEIHCDLVLNPEATHCPTAAAAPEHRDRTVTLMSGSKTWNLAGLNCSYAIIPDEARREAFKAALQSTVPPVPPLAYVATEAAYRHGGPWRAAANEYLWENYQHLVKRLADVPELHVHPLDATYLAWIDASNLSVGNAAEFFERHGVGLSDGAQFDQPGFVRLNFACPRATLDEGIDRMMAAVASLND